MKTKHMNGYPTCKRERERLNETTKRREKYECGGLLVLPEEAGIRGAEANALVCARCGEVQSSEASVVRRLRRETGIGRAEAIDRPPLLADLSVDARRGILLLLLREPDATLALDRAEERRALAAASAARLSNEGALTDDGRRLAMQIQEPTIPPLRHDPTQAPKPRRRKPVVRCRVCFAKLKGKKPCACGATASPSA